MGKDFDPTQAKRSTNQTSNVEQTEDQTEAPETPSKPEHLVKKPILEGVELEESTSEELRNLLHIARLRRDEESEELILFELSGRVETVTIEIPISELSNSGYGSSQSASYRKIKECRISIEAASALNRVYNGMLDSGEKVGVGQKGAKKLISRREHTAARILELVHAAIEKKSSEG